MTDPLSPATLRALAEQLIKQWRTSADAREKSKRLLAGPNLVDIATAREGVQTMRYCATKLEDLLNSEEPSLDTSAIQNLRDENEDLHLVAQGVKHYWGCENNAASGGGPIVCERCRAEAAEALCATLTAQVDALVSGAARDAAVVELEERCATLRSERDEARLIGAELRENLTEATAVCACGCPRSDHESYGEDGESCEHDDHECFRTSKAAQSRLAAAEASRDEALAVISTAVMSLDVHDAESLRQLGSRLKDCEWVGDELKAVFYAVEAMKPLAARAAQEQP